MSEWIPTAERLPTGDMSRIVFVQDSTDSFRRNLYASCVNKEDHVAWMELPAPYVPPKPKRFDHYIVGFLDVLGCQQSWHHQVHVREVLPGDPDPDTVLEVLEAMKEVSSTFDHTGAWVINQWVRRIEESRSKA